MPILDFHIQEVDTYVIDSIVRQVVSNLITTFDMNHIFNSQNIAISSTRHGISKTTNSDGNLVLSDNKCNVIMSLIKNPKGLKWDVMSFAHTQAYRTSPISRHNTVSLFYDRDADVNAVEIFSPVTVNLEVTFSLNTREHASQIENVLINKFYGDGAMTRQDFSYAYPLDMQFLQALLLVYKLRKTLHVGNGNVLDGFLPYLNEYIPDGISFMVRPIDNREQIVLQRNILGVLGELIYDQNEPEPVKIAQFTDRYELKFSYAIQFACPSSIRLHAPVVIENELLPEIMVPDVPMPKHLQTIQAHLIDNPITKILKEWRAFEEVGPIVQPYYDDFIRPRNIVDERKFKILFQSVLLLDEGDITTIDLKQLGSYKLHPVILEILDIQRNDTFDTYAIYNIHIVENGVRSSSDRLTMTDDLSITFKALDKTKRYHLVIAEATDVSNMSAKYLNLLLKYRWFCHGTIFKNIDRLVDLGYYKVVPNYMAIRVLDTCMASGKLDQHLRTMVITGHSTSEIYSYAASSVQLLDYLTSHKSLLSCKYLYEILIEIGEQAGCIRPGQIGHVDLITADGKYPFPINGGYYGITAPLRIFDAVIRTASRNPT